LDNLILVSHAFYYFFKEHIGGIEYSAWVPSHVNTAAVVPTRVPPAAASVSRTFLFPL
jgi:hypothetical protein